MYERVDRVHRWLFIGFVVGFVVLVVVLYGWHLVRHYTSERDCTIFKGECPNGHYCGVNGKCQLGKENDSCFLGLAQCQNPYNCYPDFKCHRF